jgi:regulator of nucleoside diphosphate kinase
MHRDSIIITQPDLLRLAHLLRACVPTWPFLSALERQLATATLAPDTDVPPDVVTMGSRFRFTDRRTGVSETYRLVYPDEADLDRGRLSVFAPIGSAVLGRRAGETVWWNVPSGLRVVRIDEVLYQPERDGARHHEDHDAADRAVGADDADDDGPPSGIADGPADRVAASGTGFHRCG